MPLRLGTNVVTSAPVAASNAANRLRVVRLVPGAAPGGRTAVNSPPTYTRPPPVARACTVPLVCHMLDGVPRSVWSSGPMTVAPAGVPWRPATVR